VFPLKGYAFMDNTRITGWGRRTPTSDVAFGRWLGRRLREMYDDVTQEPIPRELLDLIDAGGANLRDAVPVVAHRTL
jgi:hypothetical protein